MSAKLSLRVFVRVFVACSGEWRSPGLGCFFVARFLTPVTLELGGKNPVIVSKHCDVSLAAKRTIWGRMMNCGQQCIAPDYCMVQREVLEPFLSACKHWVKVLYEGEQAIWPGRWSSSIRAINYLTEFTQGHAYMRWSY